MPKSTVGKVLFVANSEVWKEIYEREAESAGIYDAEFFKDPDQAIERLEELDEIAAAIFSDGLDGRWTEIVEAAKKSNVPAFVISGDSRLKATIQLKGATFIAKPPRELGFVATALSSIPDPASN